MNRASLRFRLAAMGVLPLLCTGVLAQEDAPFDRTPADCLSVSRIDKTKAIDDQNIIFYARGDRAYRNHLPRKCPGLERENRFAYRTSVGRLCSTDTITVLEQFGVGLRNGFTCRLGEFVPLSPAEVEELEQLEEGGRGRRAIETTEVELEPENAPEEDAAADEASAEPATNPGTAPQD
jgi:hypothetical protein